MPSPVIKKEVCESEAKLFSSEIVPLKPRCLSPSSITSEDKGKSGEREGSFPHAIKDNIKISDKPIYNTLFTIMPSPFSYTYAESNHPTNPATHAYLHLFSVASLSK